MQKSQKNLIAVGGLFFVLVLAVIISRISQNKPLSLISKAKSEATPLDQNIASTVMLFGYSEISNTDSKDKLRISVPHSFPFTPQKVILAKTGANEQQVSEVPTQYPCMGEEHVDEMMRGYESGWTTQSTAENLDTKYTVYFTDSNNKLYSADYTLSHTCTVFAKGYNAQPENTIQEALPPE